MDDTTAACIELWRQHGYRVTVMTGVARELNVYNGVRQQRTFETAFLEYGALQNIARSSGKPIWFLNDPIEDNPRHSWTDYRLNWESTISRVDPPQKMPIARNP